MRETNITTGSAHARWLRDKKLALQTAQLYAKGCKIIFNIIIVTTVIIGVVLKFKSRSSRVYRVTE